MLKCQRCKKRKATGRWRDKNVCTHCYEILIKNKKWTEVPKKVNRI